jgi:RHS repeat-associated protein
LRNIFSISLTLLIFLLGLIFPAEAKLAGHTLHAYGPKASCCPFRYATKYLDEETGLYNFGRRFLDPVTGQWLSREPLGESESINLYAYTGNDPINKIDVLGLKSKWVTDPNNPITEMPDGSKVINLVWLVDKWFGDDYIDYSKKSARAFGTNYWDHHLWTQRANGSWGASAGNQMWVDASRIAEERYHLSTHARIGTVAMGGYSLALAAPAVAVASPLIAGAVGETSLAVGVRGMTYASRYTGALSRIGAVGTGALLYSGLHDPDSVGMMLSTPSPADDIAGGLRGFGLLAQDARAAGTAAWQWAKPGMGNAVESYLYRSGVVSYAVTPGQIPDDLEAQLARLYEQGLKRQQLLQSAPLPATSIMPDFPDSTMIETASLRAFPGGRDTYSPTKLIDHGPFDWSKFTHPIEVQYIDGIPYIMGGMTRVENARRAGITRLPAYIYGR